MKSTQHVSAQRTITIKYISKCRKKLSEWLHQIDERLNNFEIPNTNLQTSIQDIIIESFNFILTKPELYALLLQHDINCSDLPDDLKAVIGLPEGPEKVNHLDQCLSKLKLVADILGIYSQQKNDPIKLDYTGHAQSIKAISDFYKNRAVSHDTSQYRSQNTFSNSSNHIGSHPGSDPNNRNRFSFSSQNKDLLVDPDDASGLNNGNSKHSFLKK